MPRRHRAAPGVRAVGAQGWPGPGSPELASGAPSPGLRRPLDSWSPPGPSSTQASGPAACAQAGSCALCPAAALGGWRVPKSKVGCPGCVPLRESGAWVSPCLCRLPPSGVPGRLVPGEGCFGVLVPPIPTPHDVLRVHIELQRVRRRLNSQAHSRPLHCLSYPLFLPGRENWRLRCLCLPARPRGQCHGDPTLPPLPEQV